MGTLLIVKVDSGPCHLPKQYISVINARLFLGTSWNPGLFDFGCNSGSPTPLIVESIAPGSSFSCAGISSCAALFLSESSYFVLSCIFGCSRILPTLFCSFLFFVMLLPAVCSIFRY